MERKREEVKIREEKKQSPDFQLPRLADRKYSRFHVSGDNAISNQKVQ